jgi:hypothetical protein
MLWWTCHPATGDDEFAACGACHGTQPPEETSEDHRDYQRRNHCPMVPRDTWIDPDLPAYVAGRAAETLLGTPDQNFGEGCQHCPGAYAREPIALEARRALEWWDTGQLALLYAGGVPEVVTEAVDVARRTRLVWRAEGDRLRRPKPDEKA